MVWSFAVVIFLLLCLGALLLTLFAACSRGGPVHKKVDQSEVRQDQDETKRSEHPANAYTLNTRLNHHGSDSTV